MRLDFTRQPELTERWLVVDAESGEPIEDVAWADDEAAVYATIKKRPRLLTDPPGADLRIRTPAGAWAVETHAGAVEFIDRAVSPLKGELIALLDDPDVVAKLKDILKDTLR